MSLKTKLTEKLQFDDNDLEYMNEVDAALHRRGHPLAFILSSAIVVFFFVLGVWAYFAELDEVTRGEGQVVSAQTIQNIQNLEGGILQELRVKQGQKVAAGEILLVVNNEMSSSRLEDLKSKRLDDLATLVRLKAEQDGLMPVFSDELKNASPEIVANQIATYTLRKQQFEGERRALEATVSQRNQEVEEALARKATAEEQLSFKIRHREQIRPLVERGIHSRLDLLQVEQEIASTRGDLNTITQTIARARSGVQEAQEKMKNRDSEVLASIQAEINKVDADLRSVEATMQGLLSQQGRASIASPVDGIVQRILISTIGGTVKSGETIMEILPVDKTLLIEAQIKPQDRAHIYPSQRAIIKITAYDFSIYGGLEGTVEQISPSTIEDKRGQVFYQVRLRTKVNYIQYRGENFDIIPGMTATVDIVTGKKTVLAYLLKPITKGAQTALQER